MHPVWFRKFRKVLLDPLILMQTGSSIWLREHQKSLMAVSQRPGVKDAGDYTTDEIVDPSFNDLGWRTVDVPHDFSIEGEKVKSSSDAQAYLEGGLGYYRKRFTVPASMSGNKTISLDFEGVYQNSVVYLNGEKIGSYPSGYTGFALDITKK